MVNSILFEEWFLVFEEGEVYFVRIGEFIDWMMEENVGKVKREGEMEVFEVSGFEVLFFNRRIKKVEFKRVKVLIRYDYFGKVYIIRLKLGRRIKIIFGYSFFFVRNGEFVEVMGDELKLGDFVVVLWRLEFFERNYVLNFVELFFGMLEEEILDIVMMILVKGKKNFFKGMFRILCWIFGEEKRFRIVRCYFRYFEDLGYVWFKKIGYEVFDWDLFKNYRRFYEVFVENVRYNGNKREYFVEFNFIWDVVGIMFLKELKEWKIGMLNGFRMSLFIEVDELLVKFFGYYVSEGYVRK